MFGLEVEVLSHGIIRPGYTAPEWLAEELSRAITVDQVERATSPCSFCLSPLGFF